VLGPASQPSEQATEQAVPARGGYDCRWRLGHRERRLWIERSRDRFGLGLNRDRFGLGLNRDRFGLGLNRDGFRLGLDRDGFGHWLDRRVGDLVRPRREGHPRTPPRRLDPHRAADAFALPGDGCFRIELRDPDLPELGQVTSER
jgi:hypothetical protein